MFEILVEGMNNLRGPASNFSGFSPATPEWEEAVALIQKLDQAGSLIVDRFKFNDPYTDYAYPAESITPEMWITTISAGENRWKSYDDGKTFFYTTNEMISALWMCPEARASADGKRLMELLNLQPDVKKKIWVLQSARVPLGADLEGKPDVPRPSLKLRMRSLYGVLNLYSHVVQVPPQHEEDGRARDLSSFRAAVERGEQSNFNNEVSIRYNEVEPENAFLKIQYRGLWFYIADRDRLAKVGFNAIFDLWQLSIKPPGAKDTPVTTIQVN